MLITFGALAMMKLTGQVALAGLATAIAWGGRLVIVYQAGKWMDKFGRLKILQLGLTLTALGGILLAVSVANNFLPGFLIGLVASGLGWGVTQQNRVAVADMYPSKRRGEGVGYLLTASIVGSIAATPFVAIATLAGNAFSIDSYATIWLLSLVFLPFASLALKFVKPDPQKIALNIVKYYPEESAGSKSNGPNSVIRSTRDYLKFFPILVAFTVSALAQGNMAMMMALTSLILSQHDVHLTLISLAITIHVIGMYGFSMPLGKLSDKFGRRKLLVLAAVASAAGSLLTPLTADYWIVTLGIFFVGLGWSAGIVATTALISDLTAPSERGRIVGANDLFLSLTSLSFPALGGVVVSLLGFESLGLLGFLVSIPAMALAILLKEATPGVYKYAFADKEPSVTQATR
jgi:MFS family permease